MESLRGALAALIIGVATAIVIVALAIIPFLNPIWVGFGQDRAQAQAWTGYTTEQLRLVTNEILADLVIGPAGVRRHPGRRPGARGPRAAAHGRRRGRVPALLPRRGRLGAADRGLVRVLAQRPRPVGALAPPVDERARDRRGDRRRRHRRRPPVRPGVRAVPRAVLPARVVDVRRGLGEARPAVPAAVLGRDDDRGRGRHRRVVDAAVVVRRPAGPGARGVRGATPPTRCRRRCPPDGRQRPPDRAAVRDRDPGLVHVGGPHRDRHAARRAAGGRSRPRASRHRSSG